MWEAGGEAPGRTAILHLRSGDTTLTPFTLLCLLYLYTRSDRSDPVFPNPLFLNKRFRAPDEQPTTEPCPSPIYYSSDLAKPAKILPKMGHEPEPTAIPAPVIAAPVDVHPPDPVPDLNTQHQGGGSRLETLPAEIRWHVLSSLDLDCLKALVRASPTFHQQYLDDRRRLLLASLQVTLGSVSLDACTVAEAQHNPVSAAIECWRDQLPHRSSFQLAERSVTEDEAVAMVRFHVDVVVPVARHFMNEILDTLRRLDGTAGSQSDSDPKPSNTEWRRCLRAAYRFQLLCCNIKSNLKLRCSEAIIAITMSNHLFRAPEPWEGEELVAFIEFAERTFQDVCKDIAPEARRYNHTYEEACNQAFEEARRLFAPIGVLQFTHLSPAANRAYYQEQRAPPDGLELLRNVIDPKPEDRRLLVRSVPRTIVMSDVFSARVETMLSREIQRYARRRERDLQEEPAHRHELTNERAPLPFQGDGLDLPPLAWTQIWNCTYSDHIGGFITPTIRRWGYVFWDADRMNRGSRVHLLRSQWSQWTGRWDGDPRETLYQEEDTEAEDTEEEETEGQDTEEQGTHEEEKD